ncbi:MAG: hypothetical protein ISQ14_10025 [Verrucomicrobiae bacterium]|nr:hypothetical protein [Verrucomicrobiae bacterium]
MIIFGTSLFDRSKSETTTDTTGSFLLNDLPEGANYVTATAPGKAMEGVHVSVGRMRPTQTV